MSALTRHELVLRVVASPTGDNADAETPRAALLAARTLLREASVERGARNPTAMFLVHGETVRADVRRGSL